MAAPNTVVSAQSDTDDIAAENTLRPKNQKDYMGKESVHEQKEILISGPKKEVSLLIMCSFLAHLV